MKRPEEGKRHLARLTSLVADPMGLSDVLNYLSLAPGKDVLAPRFPGRRGQHGHGRVMLGGNSEDRPSCCPCPRVPRSGQLELAPEALTKFLAGAGNMPQGKRDVPANLQVTVTHDDKAQARATWCAVLRGSDPVARQRGNRLLGAHGPRRPRIDGDVFNGADDNASGSAGLLEIATAYAQGKEKPRRSIVFLSVSGEELGLWGSAYYADHPTWPLDKIVADINTDMIGRSGRSPADGAIAVTPSHKHASSRRWCRTRRASARARHVVPAATSTTAQRPLQLREEGHPRGVLLQRRARGLPPGHRPRRQARRRQDGAHRAARVLDPTGTSERVSACRLSGFRMRPEEAARCAEWRISCSIGPP
jgi:hypothetical protein